MKKFFSGIVLFLQAAWILVLVVGIFVLAMPSLLDIFLLAPIKEWVKNVLAKVGSKTIIVLVSNVFLAAIVCFYLKNDSAKVLGYYVLISIAVVLVAVMIAINNSSKKESQEPPWLKSIPR